MTDTPKLLPCPFCGGQPDWMDAVRPLDEKFVACTNEGCFGPSTTATGADAAVQWNMRCDDALRAENERLRAALTEIKHHAGGPYGGDERDWLESITRLADKALTPQQTGNKTDGR